MAELLVYYKAGTASGGICNRDFVLGELLQGVPRGVSGSGTVSEQEYLYATARTLKLVFRPGYAEDQRGGRIAHGGNSRGCTLGAAWLGAAEGA